MFVEDRKALRRRSERRRASPEDMDQERAEKNLRVQEIFLAKFPPASGRKIALYSAVRGEVGTDRIREQGLAAGAWLYYPRMCEDGNLTFFRHEENDGWERGRFGIREPQRGPGGEGIRKGFDLVVVPGLVFDAAGRRLGQGGGHHHWVFSRLPGGAGGA